MSAPSAAGPRPGGRLNCAARLLGQGALLWLALALVDLAVATATPQSIVHDGRLTGSIRAGLVFVELGALAVLVGLAIAAALSLPVLGLLLPGRHDLRRPLLTAAVGLAGFVVTLFVLASWAALLATGRFADLSGIRFWAENAVQFTRHVAHMKPTWLVAAPLASVALSALVFLAFRRMERGLETRSVAGLAALPIVTLLCGGSALLTLRPDEGQRSFSVFDPETGVTSTLGDLYEMSREERAGPASRLLFDMAHTVAPSRDTPIADGTIRVARAPIVTLESFLEGEKPTARPNVVVLLLESLRADELTASGGNRVVMPTLEALAREGRTFTDAICQSSHSNYADPCPLSGAYPLRSARSYTYTANATYPRVFVYDVLKAIGYRTALISSQNESWGGMRRFLDNGGLDTILDAESYSGPTFVPRNDAGFTAFVAGTKRSGKIDDRFTVREAIDWIGTGGGKPFFLCVNLQSSHVPYDTPSDFEPPFPVRRDFDIFFGQFPRDRTRDVRDLYSNSLAYMDLQIGKLVRHLKENGLYENTVIVATGDNGEAFFEHDHAAHAGPLYQEALHVAFVLRGPGVPAGPDDRPAQHVDIPPTILGLLGLPPHPAFQGVDLLSPDRREGRLRFAVAQSPVATQYTVLNRGHKLIVDTRRGFSLLFDLALDPGERMDLSRVRPDRAVELRRWLDTWRAVQVEYYQRIGEHTKRYPPSLEDPVPSPTR
jgi:arylsulfatase A-like enzyme